MLLCRNARDEWELPGGRPDPGESEAQTLRRELREETGLEIEVGVALGTEALQVLPGRWVDVVAYTCMARVPGAAPPLTASDEHSRVAWVDPATVAAGELPGVYRRIIERAARAMGSPPGGDDGAGGPADPARG